MKTVFAFEDPAVDDEANLLILETGNRHCCYGLYREEQKQFCKLLFMQHDAWEAESCYHTIAEKASAEKYNKTILAVAFPEAVVVPDLYRQKTGALLNTLFDLPGRTAFQDHIIQRNMTVAYQLSDSIVEATRQFFQSPNIVHSYSASLRQNETVNGAVIRIRFSGYEFSVVVEVDGKLFLVQTYEYHTPLDVVYYLLKICYEFSFSQSEVAVQLSGFIEEESSLYTELNQYFSNISFAMTPPSLTASTEHPSYYFQPLHNVALCAS